MSENEKVQPEKQETSSSEEQITFTNRMDLSGVKKLVDSVRSEIGKLIVGQENMVELIITALLADGHILIEGVPGVAKTLTSKLLAKTMNVEFSRIQFTPDLMPSDVIGTSVFNPKTTDFEFKKGPIFSNLVLIDEVNRSPAKTQSALFEAMEERQVSVDGVTHILEAPFMVIATQNPIEHEGTYRLPEAQLDRFLFKIDVPYPSLDHEIEILKNSFSRGNVIDLGLLEQVVDSNDLLEQKILINKVHVEPELMKYIAEIVQSTRNSSSISVGASPRASVFVMRAAQAWAAIKGRDFITPEDVKAIIKPVLRHRIILTPEKEMEGISPDKVIEITLEKVEVPR